MVERLATSAMGTRFEFVLCGEPGGRLRSVGEMAIEEVVLWHQRLSAFASDSLVSHINRTAGDESVRVDADVWELLVLCDEVWRASDGAFDATIGGAMQEAGFHPGDGALSRGWGDCVALNADARSVRFTRAGVRLDLGAVAKGFALERAAAILREHGVRSALLHGGTSCVVAIGAPPSEDGWRVAVRSDAEPRLVTLRNRAMSVSAPRGRRNSDGHGHILDPRTGVSAGNADTAAVLCARADLADAWSTALVVLGKRPTGMPQDAESLIHSGRCWDEVSSADSPNDLREMA